jgi:hypothetical protein
MLGLDAIVEPSICDPPDGYFEGGDRHPRARQPSQFAELTGKPRALASPPAGN